MEVQIYQANLDKKIGEYFTTNEYSDLTVLITEWRNYLGIKDVLTDVDLEMCINHIKELYSEFSLSMIRMAIKSSLKGELKVDIKPYNSFSPMYISTILNAYKSYNDRIVSDHLRAQRRKEMEQLNKPKEYSDEQKIQNRLKYLNHYKDNCQSSILDFQGIMWEYLTRNDLVKDISPDMEIVEKEKQKKKNDFIELSLSDIESLEKWSIMRKFFELNPDFDFNYEKHNLFVS